MLLLMLFAFLGGIVTILSPCILPILPVVLSGSVGGGKKKPIGIVLGFILSFTFFTLFLTTIVRLTGLSADFMRNLAVIVIFIFGIVLLIPQVQGYLETLFSKIANLAPKTKQTDGLGGGVLIGMSLGLIWTPCVGPILAGVISLALTGSVTGSAFFITLAYSLGTVIPMLAIIYGGRALLQKVPWLLKNTGKIQKVFGVIMILTAMGIFFNIDRKFQAYILTVFPNYGSGLTQIEDNSIIQEELDQLNNIETEIEENKIPKSSGVQAPELIVGGKWINSKPLTLEELRGQVVLLDFMTYSCINCIRTFPYLNEWHTKYADDGLVIIGLHTPEFEFEKNVNNVKKALVDFGIEFPVMQDNDHATWRAYKNRYWPRKYLLNIKGEIVYDHIGEGKYQETEAKIQELLAEKLLFENSTNRVEQKLSILEDAERSKSKSPETYFGSGRNEYLANGKIKSAGEQDLKQPIDLVLNKLYLAGRWNFTDEYASNLGSNAKIIYSYDAMKVFIVASADKPTKVEVKLDGEYLTDNAGSDVKFDNNISYVEIKEDRLYRLVETDSRKQHQLELNIIDPGLKAFAFTFG